MELTRVGPGHHHMRKFLNNPERFADEALEGLLLAHPGRARRLPEEPRAVVRADGSQRGRVAIATGGGSGHLPLFVGYVVRGLADGCAVGNMFASPSTEVMLAVTRAIDSGKGVLYLYGNYGGDRINFEAAADLAGDHGIAVESVRAADDILSAPAEQAAQRRGIAGIFFGYAVAAGAAHEGRDLAEVAALTRYALSRTRSIGVALSGAILPTVGAPNFELGPDEMEIGTGIHGEPGTRRGPLVTADELVEEMVPQLITELGLSAGDEVAVLVNGLGATPREELYLIYRGVHQLLEKAQVTPRHVFVGEYATSLEMAGASISLLHLDETVEPLIAAAAAAQAPA
ncbi:dihydroxyacetone kinase subunit DhaK [Dactylosporangium sp. CA-092794]|uniref:dihydroxyacetone kinase subunit DhaK n=1 Tax=Dactylosporangium sp. CA-092794 TaxID=3239929 RepID=UPI003D8CDE40